MAKYIFLVHGYSSNSKKTWRSFKKYLEENEINGFEIGCLEYVSPPKWQFWKSAPSHMVIAESLKSQLEDRCEDLENDEIILIGHSNGGVAIKKLLVRLSLMSKAYNITKVCFLDVPHHGSGLASAGAMLGPRNKHIKALRLNSPELMEINDLWLFEDFYKKFEILNLMAEVENAVPAFSARSNFSETIVVPGTDHSSITCPNSKDSFVMKRVVEFIRGEVKLKKFKNELSKSYEDWRKFDERYHSLDYVEDEERKKAFQSLALALSSDQPLVRITGLSGLGKSRLIIEYINKFEIPKDEVLVYDASINHNGILESIRPAIESGCTGLIILDACEVSLHDKLERIFDAVDSKLKVVTVGFYHENVGSSAHIKLERLEGEKIGTLVKSILSEADGFEVDRIKRFVEGFPLLAEMISTQLRESGGVQANFTERDLLEKLINADGDLKDSERHLLQVISLFDYFKYQDSGLENLDSPVNFIKRISGVDSQVFDKIISQYSRKEIVNCTGAYARLVPKPLALNLALEWWNNSLYERQSELIESMPAVMLDSFCKQIKYLDSSENVQSFVADFYGANRPFGQAELLFSSKGSRLFRTLVEVNPEATSNALYRVLQSLSDDEIKKVSGDARRNLVWSLEMLCFHRAHFEKSAWCLYKLAINENESFGNNATGQFCQLFRWQLSGTQADFDQRLNFLSEIVALEDISSDLLIIDAVDSAFSTFGRTRTVGAEYQGTKPEMKEWLPQRYDEIYSYWNNMFSILTDIFVREGRVKKLKQVVGNNIRELIRYNIVDGLDNLINTIVDADGKYWPEASQAIVHILEHDLEGMPKDRYDAIDRWQKLLSPECGDFTEKLTLLVLDPPIEYVEEKDGGYVDVAEKRAVAFADSLVSFQDLEDSLPYLMSFKEQKQSRSFARSIGENGRGDLDSLVNSSIECVSNSLDVNMEFLRGLFSGVHLRDKEQWKEYTERFLTNDALHKFYPSIVSTGSALPEQLEKIITLIKNGLLESSSSQCFTYGGSLNHLSESDLVAFTEDLSEIDKEGSWNAFSILHMYMYGRKDYDFKQIVSHLESLVLQVSFDKDDRIRSHDSYAWMKSVERLLEEGSDNFPKDLIVYVLDQIVINDVELSDIWNAMNPVLCQAFKYHASDIWPFFSKFVIKVDDPIKRMRLVELFDASRERARKGESIFSFIDEDEIVEWCADEIALNYVVRSTKLLETQDDSDEKVPNSRIVKLIDKYSDNRDFLGEVASSFNSRTWIGSIIPSLEADKAALSPLLNHESSAVKLWVSEFIEMIDREILYNSRRESEERFAGR